MVGILTKNSSEKSNAPHMPGVPSLGLNIDRCINSQKDRNGFPGKCGRGGGGGETLHR